MDRHRLIQCQGDNLAYIKHLGLHFLKLESTRYPESLESRQHQTL